jgi:hypothetical protein
METTYFSLASKSNFNKALRHFYAVTDIVDDVDVQKNLADVVNEEIDNGEIVIDQILPIVGAIVRDKYSYCHKSFNLRETVHEFTKICEDTAKWSALDIVMVYIDPSGKVFLINPKNQEHWDRVRELCHDQLIVFYVKYLKGNNPKIELNAIHAMKEMLAGKDVFVNKEFIDHTAVPKKVVKKEKPHAEVDQRKNITPKYAVQVSNELFHNGNVEAWKKIIESYMTKFPDLEVHVYFKNEPINDINSLFKWGKVKHGDQIFIQVAGEDIRGVSKLQKYLYEGASHRFEQFLKIGVGQVLNLF